MADGLSDAASGTYIGRALPMTTRLEMNGNGVSTLEIGRVTPMDMPYVNAWLFAFGLTSTERHKACCVLQDHGELSFCNIKHKITVRCKMVR